MHIGHVLKNLIFTTPRREAELIVMQFGSVLRDDDDGVHDDDTGMPFWNIIYNVASRGHVCEQVYESLQYGRSGMRMRLMVKCVVWGSSVWMYFFLI